MVTKGSLAIIGRMRRRFLVALVAGAAILFASAEDLPDPDAEAAFPKIRADIRASLSHLPNYTCEERIIRYEQRSAEDSAHVYDRIRLEVAFVGARELFGWPGVGRFEDKSIDAMIGGTTGTGAFAGVPLQIFDSKLSRFFTVKENDDEKRPNTLHYKFVFPRVENGFLVGAGDRRGFVGFHGSFWVNRKTSGLIRLELQADEIPKTVPLSEVKLNVAYQVLHLDGQDYVVPKTAEQIMVTTAGYITRNFTAFDNCHQFRGESTIKFENLEDSDHPAAVTKVITLPEKLTLDVVLKNGLALREPSIGDPVEGVSDRDVKKGHELLIPKGAKLMGRIAKLRFVDADTPFYSIAIKFHTARYDNTEARLDTQTMGISPNVKVSARPNRWMNNQGYNYLIDRLPDSTFYVRGRELDLPRGMHMYLNTVKETP